MNRRNLSGKICLLLPNSTFLGNRFQHHHSWCMFFHFQFAHRRSKWPLLQEKQFGQWVSHTTDTSSINKIKTCWLFVYSCIAESKWNECSYIYFVRSTFNLILYIVYLCSLTLTWVVFRMSTTSCSLLACYFLFNGLFLMTTLILGWSGIYIFRSNIIVNFYTQYFIKII